MKNRAFLPTIVATLISLALASLSWPQQPNQVSNVMHAKLEHAQQILQGLTSEDFELIRKNAQQLSLLSLATNWEVLQTPDYFQQSKEFQRTADNLAKAAEKKNIDAAALAYVDVTMKCIACHKYVRDAQASDSQKKSTK